MNLFRKYGKMRDSRLKALGAVPTPSPDTTPTLCNCPTWREPHDKHGPPYLPPRDAEKALEAWKAAQPQFDSRTTLEREG